jgi:hypothetical protein
MLEFLSLLAMPLFLEAKTGPCEKFKNYGKADIIFEVVQNPIEYNYRVSKKALTRMSEDSTKEWIQKHQGHAWLSSRSKGKQPELHTHGVTRGGYNVGIKMEFTAKPYDRYGVYYCPFVKKAHVTINYSSEIFVANDFKQGSCEFNEIMKHEMKHHDTNVTVVKTIADRMNADSTEIIRYMTRQYIPREQVEAYFETMKEGLRDAIQVYGQEMTDRMSEFNAHIDTPEEYVRVSKTCKG